MVLLCGRHDTGHQVSHSRQPHDRPRRYVWLAGLDGNRPDDVGQWLTSTLQSSHRSNSPRRHRRDHPDHPQMGCLTPHTHALPSVPSTKERPGGAFYFLLTYGAILRRKSIDIAREECGFLHILEPNDLLSHTFESHPKATLHRHTVPH